MPMWPGYLIPLWYRWPYAFENTPVIAKGEKIPIPPSLTSMILTGNGGK